MMPKFFSAGERVVYHDPKADVLMRGVVRKMMLASCVVWFPRQHRELLVAVGLLRRCPVRLAYCRPRADAPRGAA